MAVFLKEVVLPAPLVDEERIWDLDHRVLDSSFVDSWVPDVLQVVIENGGGVGVPKDLAMFSQFRPFPWTCIELMRPL
jgi:hypothetical protein